MLEKIKSNIVDQLGVDEENITLETSLKDDLGADSLDLFELVMKLEEDFEIEIPSDDLECIQTVGDMVQYLKGKGIAE